GPRGSDRACRVRRAVSPPAAQRAPHRAREVQPPAADRAARRLRAPGAGLSRRRIASMKLYYFSEMPHHEFPDAEGDKYPSLRLGPRRRRQELVGQHESRAQPRALRGVPRSHLEMLDRGGAVPVGGAPLPLPPREPVVPPAPETAPADLDPRYREPGDGHLGRTPGLHLRAVPGAVRHRTRALRLLPPGRGRSGTYG